MTSPTNRTDEVAKMAYAKANAYEEDFAIQEISALIASAITSAVEQAKSEPCVKCGHKQ